MRSSKEAINERSQLVFKQLVELYLRDGQPVGSRTLVDSAHLLLSSATVRNIMADLEDQGYLHSPHTSAGRIPTARGLRFFIDSLLTVQKLDNALLHQIKHEIHPDLDKSVLLANTSELLSQLTHLAGLVTVPQQGRLILRHIEFLPLSNQRILVILVINEREVRNLIIHTQQEYTVRDLEQAGNYINYTYAGMELTLVRKQLIAALHTDKQKLDSAMQTALDLANKALKHSAPAEKDYVLAGTANLLGYTEGIDTLRGLFEAFARKRDILHLLDNCLQAEGVQIFIGEEAGFNEFIDFSLVTAPYHADGEIVGVLGVIGPKHMAYDQVVPAVDITARLLGQALKNAS